MKISRRLSYAAGLGAALVFAWRASGLDHAQPEIVAPVQRHAHAGAAPAQTRTAEAVIADSLCVADRSTPEVETDLFKSVSWQAAPPPRPAPPPSPPPPPPTAPPLPYQFLGQYIEGADRIVILARGDRVVTARTGDTIDGSYRVESVRNGLVTLIYLPLDIRQTLATGVAQ